MEIQKNSIKNDIVEIVFTGPLETTGHVQEMENAILTELNKAKHIVLNFDQVTSTSGTVRGFLIKAQELAESKKIGLFILGLRSELKEQFDKLSFLNIFKFIDSHQQAIEKVVQIRMQNMKSAYPVTLSPTTMPQNISQLFQEIQSELNDLDTQYRKHRDEIDKKIKELKKILSC